MKIPKTNCKACDARDRIIGILAKRIDELENNDNERTTTKRTILGKTLAIKFGKRTSNSRQHPA